MSSLWTPSGERPVPRPGTGGDPDRDRRSEAAGEGQTPGGAQARGDVPPTARPTETTPGAEGPRDEPTEEELRARMTQLRDQLAGAPAEAVVANHAYGLFELGALHLSLDPPQLPQAQLAIDGLALLVEGLHGRLGDQEASLLEGLAQIRLAFVQISGSADLPAPPAPA